ncbi:MAG: MBL fold metallo-hydrolase RNA specificity domain-containing protein [Thermoguttaceae bacterium]
MRIQFLGANRQVTGSKHLLEVGGLRLLIDCGVYQEREFTDRNWEEFPVDLRSIDAILLTHAHNDHCGMLPRMVTQGFHAPVYATRATAQLTEIILEDSARIQEEDAEYKRKRHRKEGRRGKHPVVPLFGSADVRKALPLLQPVSYGREVPIGKEVRVTFHDAGHILGSSIVEVVCSENGDTRRLLFSGDLGQRGKPILRDPTVFTDADYVILESTYGNRTHNDAGDVEGRLAQVVCETLEAGGNVVVPVFAVERAQELIYHLGRLIGSGRIPKDDVILNSPMASEVTQVFHRHRECFDDEAWSMIQSGGSPLQFDGLQIVQNIEQSKAIHKRKRPAIIMATSGMCTAGRIKHHLRHNISRRESTILFVGYQAGGTLGRKILDGSREVRILGEVHRVEARIERIEGFSGHADRNGLLHWLDGLKQPPRHVFLVHGEEEGAVNLADTIGRQPGWEVTVPNYLDRMMLN